MKRIFLVVFAVFALAACDSKKEEAPAAEAPAAEAEAKAPAAADGLVEVAADGTSFDPAIKKDQLPDGVYYCDMGTVHYARGEQGDNKCPLCNMMLTHKKAAGEAEAAPAEGAAAEEDHAEHDHE